MSERKTNAAPVLRALALCAALLAGGCSRDDGEAADAAPPPYVPESYMKDPEFREGMATRRKAREAVVAERAEVLAKMREMEAAAGGAEALATNAEWKALSEELVRLNARYDDAQREVLRYVRARIVPPNVKQQNAKSEKSAKNVEQ